MASVIAIGVLLLLVCAMLAVIVSALIDVLFRRSPDVIESSPERPGIVITLVHGTWARRAQWTRPHSRLCRALRDGLPSVLLERFVWGGGNSIKSREHGAQALSRHLRGLVSRYPDAHHYIIAHSHGGNIAMYALREDVLRDRIGLICLSTPFLHVKPRLVPKISGFALTAAAVMLPLIVREAAENQFWPDGPEALNVVSVLVALAVGIALVIRLPRAARRVSGRLALTGVSPSRCLLIRVAGDEASAALGSLQLINWLTTVLWVRPADLLQAGYDRVMEWSNALERFNRAAMWTAMAAAIWLLIGYMVGGPLGSALMRAAIPVGVLLIVYALIRRSQLDIVLYGFFFLGIFFAPLPILLGLVLLPFGPGLAPFAALLDVSAEPTPPGVWTVCQLPTQPSDEPIPMTHSASYQLPEAIDLVITWLRERERLAVAT